MAEDFPSLKAKWVVMQHAKKPATIFDDLAFVPEHDLLDSSWIDNAHDLPSKAASRQGKPAWQVHLKPPVPSSTDVAPSSLRNSPLPRDANLEGLLAAQLPPPGGAGGSAAGNAAALREEEMEAWFQYPLGEPIDSFGRLRAVEGLSVDDGGQGLENWRADEISAVQAGVGADMGAHAAALCGNLQAQMRAEPVGASATEMGGRGAGGLNSMVAASLLAQKRGFGGLGGAEAGGGGAGERGEREAQLAKPMGATSATPAVSAAPAGAVGVSSSAAPQPGGSAGIAGVSARLASKALAALKSGKLASSPASSAGDSNALAAAPTEGIRDAAVGTTATAAAGTASGAAGASAPGVSKPPASRSNVPRQASESNASAAAIAGASHGAVTGNCGPNASQSAASRPLPYAPLNVSRQQQQQRQRQLHADARQPDQPQEPAGTTAERSPDAGHASTVTSNAPAGCGANGAHKAERAATGSSGMVRRAEEGSGGGSGGASGGEGSAGGGTERTGQAERPARTASMGGTKDSWLPGASRGGARGGRKRGREEGEYARTEDLPEESLDTRRTGATGATGATSGAGRRSGMEGSAAKRARAAEVHNMSERVSGGEMRARGECGDNGQEVGGNVYGNTEGERGDVGGRIGERKRLGWSFKAHGVHSPLLLCSRAPALMCAYLHASCPRPFPGPASSIPPSQLLPRRDRINERMKALQQLIPNSNKTDKASMLDEAIEYLRVLQLIPSSRSLLIPSFLPCSFPRLPPTPLQTDKASMLDEAIEYLRMLQLQLHVMSARTGIALPPALALPHPTSLSALPGGGGGGDGGCGAMGGMGVAAGGAERGEGGRQVRAAGVDPMEAYLARHQRMQQQHQHQQHMQQQHMQQQQQVSTSHNASPLFSSPLPFLLPHSPLPYPRSPRFLPLSSSFLS
ncbi:unnamed protein product [Closterium sp. Naga37s-1]|nr:unnamed protein product [Closterium sp. Naga37s-1]